MHKDCGQCGGGFEIADEDRAFFIKVSPEFNGKRYEILPPTLCPDCRQQRRLVLRNERSFYKRKCDLTGNDVISVYSPSFRGKVYGLDAWHSDKWNPLEYGRDFDFNRPFFEQFNELSLDVPRICVVNMSSENSTYTNHSAYNKNCYMCINTGYSEDLYYCSNYNLNNKNCVDCLAILDCEMCYFCTDVKKSHFSKYLFECQEMVDCSFCYDCKSCKDCFGCWNLRQKQYCFYNEQLSKEEYEERVKSLSLETWDDYMKYFDYWRDMKAEKAIHRHLVVINCKDSTGNYLKNCKNVQHSYNVFESEDCKYNYDSGKMKDCYDVTEPFNEQMHYEIHGSFNGYHNLFCNKCLESKNSLYSQYCWHSNDLFGCFGLDRYKYCVFNKQYTKEEYEELVPRIIEHMIGTGEWGEFFPAKYSPFAYEETIANDYYPKSDVSQKNDNKPFKLMDAEKKFYGRMGLPEPELHPDERFRMRMGLRNPRKLRKTECGNCGCEIDTTYPEGSVKNVYCEECYNKAIYG